MKVTFLQLGILVLLVISPFVFILGLNVSNMGFILFYWCNISDYLNISNQMSTFFFSPVNILTGGSHSFFSFVLCEEQCAELQKSVYSHPIFINTIVHYFVLYFLQNYASFLYSFIFENTWILYSTCTFI